METNMLDETASTPNPPTQHTNRINEWAACVCVWHFCSELFRDRRHSTINLMICENANVCVCVRRKFRWHTIFYAKHANIDKIHVNTYYELCERRLALNMLSGGVCVSIHDWLSWNCVTIFSCILLFLFGFRIAQVGRIHLRFHPIDSLSWIVYFTPTDLFYRFNSAMTNSNAAAPNQLWMNIQIAEILSEFHLMIAQPF